MSTVAPVSPPSTTTNQTSCSNCGNSVPTDEATAMRVIFTTIPKPVRTKRSRTVAWLCPDCLDRNDVWNLPPYTSPGDTPTKAVLGQP